MRHGWAALWLALTATPAMAQVPFYPLPYFRGLAMGNQSAPALSNWQTFSVDHTGSDATNASGNNLWVNRWRWSVNSPAPGSGIRFNGFFLTDEPSGADPGETWSLFVRMNTYASTASTNAVGLYSQAERSGLPASGVGVPLLAGVIEARDSTGAASASAGRLRSLELDMIASGADDYSPAPGREVMLMSLRKGSGASPTISSLLGVYPVPGDGVTVKQGIHFENSTTFTQSLFETTQAVQNSGAHAIWLRDNHDIALDSAGNHVLRFDSATSRLKYYVNGTAVWSVDNSGNVRASGTITGSTTP